MKVFDLGLYTVTGVLALIGLLSPSFLLNEALALPIALLAVLLGGLLSRSLAQRFSADAARRGVEPSTAGQRAGIFLVAVIIAGIGLGKGATRIAHEIIAQPAEREFTVGNMLPRKGQQCYDSADIREHWIPGNAALCDLPAELWELTNPGDRLRITGRGSIFGFSYGETWPSQPLAADR